MHFCGFSFITIYIFIYSFFFLSTWGHKSKYKPAETQTNCLSAVVLFATLYRSEQNSESGRDDKWGEGGKCTVAQGEKIWRREK